MRARSCPPPADGRGAARRQFAARAVTPQVDSVVHHCSLLGFLAGSGEPESVLRVELRDVAELLLPRGHQCVDGRCLQFRQVLLQYGAQQACAGLAAGMDAVWRLGDDLVHAAQRRNLGRGDAHGFGSQMPSCPRRST